MPFNEFFHRLFSFGKATHSCSNLHRSESFWSAYKKWAASNAYHTLTKLFFDAYHYQKSHIKPSPFRVQLIEESNVQGAILFYDPNISPQDFSFLFELINERVQQIGYKQHSSDIRKVCHVRYKEQIERHVLIPPASDVPGTDLCNQLYGIIHIDSVFVNKLPGYIRFVANTYTDTYFSKPLPFMELIKVVLQPEEYTGKASN
ncbi:hypothetical protein [Pontibacter cellulosilyticus]|uniref:Uncharacterized protein n=1 Tax=Pontibacter cellulosilyticus TaxID=1720253 RepID=A0A923N1Y8_9BACT|nr:hypothetical protein [Pontibacter cellulosilyticus]MBC5991380.1 hypothetical protein [Pontibacter cellulosilyticus]